MLICFECGSQNSMRAWVACEASPMFILARFKTKLLIFFSAYWQPSYQIYHGPHIHCHLSLEIGMWGNEICRFGLCRQFSLWVASWHDYATSFCHQNAFLGLLNERGSSCVYYTLILVMCEEILLHSIYDILCKSPRRPLEHAQHSIPNITHTLGQVWTKILMLKSYTSLFPLKNK